MTFLWHSHAKQNVHDFPVRKEIIMLNHSGTSLSLRDISMWSHSHKEYKTFLTGAYFLDTVVSERDVALSCSSKEKTSLNMSLIQIQACCAP